MRASVVPWRADHEDSPGAEGRCRPLALVITPGQRADCAQFERVMDNIRVPRTGLGRPRRTPDRAYNRGVIRADLRRRGIRHVIPEKNDGKAAVDGPQVSTKTGTRSATRLSGQSIS